MSNTHVGYPVVVEKAEDGGIGMYFPDFPGTAILSINITDGMRRSKEMLADLVLEKEEQGQPLPAPSDLDKIELLDTSDRIVFVEVYMPPYRNGAADKAVTKNCTLPKWLSDAAKEAGLNFSQLLQASIKEALNLPPKRL
jgi:predicted RNase H-like HicB family nuclease